MTCLARHDQIPLFFNPVGWGPLKIYKLLKVWKNCSLGDNQIIMIEVEDKNPKNNHELELWVHHKYFDSCHRQMKMDNTTKVHNGKKPFTCDLCSSAFADSWLKTGYPKC